MLLVVCKYFEFGQIKRFVFGKDLFLPDSVQNYKILDQSKLKVFAGSLNVTYCLNLNRKDWKAFLLKGKKNAGY